MSGTKPSPTNLKKPCLQIDVVPVKYLGNLDVKENPRKGVEGSWDEISMSDFWGNSRALFRDI